MSYFGITYVVAVPEPIDVASDIEAHVIAKGSPKQDLEDAGFLVLETTVYSLIDYEVPEDSSADMNVSPPRPRRLIRDNPQA